MNTISYFEIQADDCKATAAFYNAVFGWSFTPQQGMPIEYWRIETPGIAGGLLKRPVPTPPKPAGTNAYVCSIEVEDFDVTAKVVLGKGGQVAMAKFAVPGRCWQGYFIDPAGNTFGVFEVDVAAK